MVRWVPVAATDRRPACARARRVYAFTRHRRLAAAARSSDRPQPCNLLKPKCQHGHYLRSASRHRSRWWSGATGRHRLQANGALAAAAAAAARVAALLLARVRPPVADPCGAPLSVATPRHLWSRPARGIRSLAPCAVAAVDPSALPLPCRHQRHPRPRPSHLAPPRTRFVMCTGPHLGGRQRPPPLEALHVHRRRDAGRAPAHRSLPRSPRRRSHADHPARLPCRPPRRNRRRRRHPGQILHLAVVGGRQPRQGTAHLARSRRPPTRRAQTWVTKERRTLTPEGYR